MLDASDFRLLSKIQLGLPISPRPYHDIAVALGITEAEVIERLTILKQTGLIKRLGVIVKHRQLGYRANAMIVWNIPDDRVKPLGELISRSSFVTLCYQRPRTPEWPYNLYCMIHGKNRNTVLAQIEQLTGKKGSPSRDHGRNGAPSVFGGVKLMSAAMAELAVKGKGSASVKAYSEVMRMSGLAPADSRREENNQPGITISESALVELRKIIEMYR